MNAPGLVRQLRDPQVEHRAGQRQRRCLAYSVAGLQPGQHRVERIAHCRVEIWAEAKGDLASWRLRVHSWNRPLRDQLELKLGRHTALDGGTRHLSVALGSMAVADAQQRTRHGNRQVQDRSGDQFLAVDVAAADRPGRDGGVLTGLVPGDTRYAVERGYPHRVPPVAGSYARVRVDLPQQPGRRPLVQAEPPRQRGLPARSDGEAPRVGPKRYEAHRK